MIFQVYPPEINAKWLTGHGIDSMRDAREKWRTLARNLAQAHKSIEARLPHVARAWQGPAATQLDEVRSGYLPWLREVAEDASRTYAGMCGVIKAYELAVARMVPVETIELNYAMRLSLAKSSVLAPNALAKIAGLEQQYLQFWENNARVMDTYALATTYGVNKLPQWQWAPKLTK